jgi:hypothetical protein
MDIGRLTVRLPPGADALRTGIWLLDRGLWPVVISGPNDPKASSPGKSPLRKDWGRKKPSVEKLRALYRWHPEAGIGLLLGPRGKVVDLEIDDPGRAAPFLERLFPAGLPETLGWRSARGEHRLFLWDDRLAALATSSVLTFAGGAVELRIGAEEKQVATVCPPSAGADRVPRRWNGIWKIFPIPEPLIAELERLSQERGSRTRVPCGRRPGRTHRHDRYAESALAREIEIVAEAGPGMRNRTLNRAAFNLGQLVASGFLGREEVEGALRDAAFAAGLHEREIEPTLKSGLEAGMNCPRKPPGWDEGREV